MKLRTPFYRLAAASLIAVAALACDTSPTGPSVPANETFDPSLGVNISAMTKISDDLYIQDLVVGTGAVTVAKGRTVTVIYSGYLVNGELFDSNVGEPVAVFTLGLTPPQVITGWELGLLGMKAGGKRKLVIGSLYAYGAAGREGIPRHATLVFDVEMTNVQ